MSDSTHKSQPADLVETIRRGLDDLDCAASPTTVTALEGLVADRDRLRRLVDAGLAREARLEEQYENLVALRDDLTLKAYERGQEVERLKEQLERQGQNIQALYRQKRALADAGVLIGEERDRLVEQLSTERQNVEDTGKAAVREARRCDDFRRRYEEKEREWAVERDRANGLMEQLKTAQDGLRRIAEKNLVPHWTTYQHLESCREVAVAALRASNPATSGKPEAS